MASTLVASAARTSSSTAAVTFPRVGATVKGAVFALVVSVAATGAGDLLDVYVQHTVDGTNYDDFVHFTQVLGNGGAKKFHAQWERDVAPTSALHALADASLAAGVSHGPLGPTWRVKWVITDGGGGVQSFTFAVYANYIFD